MHHNNHVFLTGTVVSYREQVLSVDGVSLTLLELQVETVRSDEGGRHRVLLQGHQALELLCRLRTSGQNRPEVMVLGWLCSWPDGVTVMADQVTVLGAHEVVETDSQVR